MIFEYQMRIFAQFITKSQSKYRYDEIIFHKYTYIDWTQEGKNHNTGKQSASMISRLSDGQSPEDLFPPLSGIHRIEHVHRYTFLSVTHELQSVFEICQ